MQNIEDAIFEEIKNDKKLLPELYYTECKVEEVSNFERELIDLPDGNHNDLVDALTYSFMQERICVRRPIFSMGIDLAKGRDTCITIIGSVL